MIRLSSLVFWLFVAGASLQASTRAELVSLHEKVPAGTVLQVALLVTPTEKSHVYYLAPGEMGFPVSIQWKNLPEGVVSLPDRPPNGQAQQTTNSAGGGGRPNFQSRSAIVGPHVHPRLRATSSADCG